MVTKTKWLLLFLYLCSISYVFGQQEDTYFKRKLIRVDDQWHKVVLPNDLYNKISNDLSDIRIYGFPANGDTLEIPYTWRIPENKIVSKGLDFKLINSSSTSEGYYFTFELGTTEDITEVHLSFVQQNYDWKLSLQGSQDLKEWFNILDNYRILSIKNDLTDYQFGKVVFPRSKYKYYRFFIKSKEKPALKDAKVIAYETSEVVLSKRISSHKIIENRKGKTTTLDIDILNFCPVSEISIFCDKKVEFYRPFELKALRDSTKLASGEWTYHFGSTTVSTLSSLDNNHFSFDNVWTKKLKLIIQNHDNAPLKIDSIHISGPDYTIIGRFDSKDIPYYLFYGNKKLYSPTYDIAHFTTPENVVSLEMGNEEVVKTQIIPNSPLFENKWWLWLLMIFIILLLGGFTLKMMKGNN